MHKGQLSDIILNMGLDNGHHPIIGSVIPNFQR